MLTNEMKNALTPNSEFLKKFLDGMGDDFKSSVVKMQMNELDFALFVVRCTVHMELMSMNEIWDHVFGAGSYETFKHGIMDILNEKCD